jgi:hypothetical protein
MLYELRIYETVPGKMPDLHKRFSEVTLNVWARHGIKQLGFWTGEISENTNNALTYILVWESLADREKKWAAFQADPEWIEKRAASEAAGPIVARVRSSFLRPTPYSALQ